MAIVFDEVDARILPRPEPQRPDPAAVSQPPLPASAQGERLFRELTRRERRRARLLAD
jgi:hypothetical protein